MYFLGLFSKNLIKSKLSVLWNTVWIERCLESFILHFGFTDKPYANRPGKEREEILEEEIQALSLVRIFFFINSKHCLFLVFVSIEKIYQTLQPVAHHLSKHLR